MGALGGHLDFFGIDMAADINTFEDGSYTFACWIKPIGSAGGQGFIWGQTNQGIHNGIRNGGVLHSAHWGADWNASTPLEAEEWIHAVWTYDGAADTAAIYLNGQLDGGPQAQRAPNGSGTFVLGARNNGSGLKGIHRSRPVSEKPTRHNCSQQSGYHRAPVFSTIVTNVQGRDANIGK